MRWPVTGSISVTNWPLESVLTPVGTVHDAELLVNSLYELRSPVQGFGEVWLANHAPPTPAKNTPRMPPMTPIGVSAASMSGNRSSALANTVFDPANCR